MDSSLKKFADYWIIPLVILYILVLYRTAWLSDDSYITLRSVDNFVNGLGPVWNPSERVQVFTHPLWYQVLSAVYFFTHEAFFTTLGVSLFISILVFGLFWLFFKPSIALVISLTILSFSNAYVDYSTSGLENPLTHLLLLCFVFLYLRPEPNIKLVSVLAGLIVLNRMDLALLLLPALLWLFLRSPQGKTLLTLSAGFIPFILWELFATFYYGFPFPNTAYAKLNVLIPRMELIQQGLWYFVNSLHGDPLTLVVTFAGVFLALRAGSVQRMNLALGNVLYLLYVVWFGGDFMSGRFFSTPLLLSVMLLNDHFKRTPLKTGTIASIFIVIFLLKFLSLTVNPSFLNTQKYTASNLIDSHGIADEQSIYVSEAGLIGSSWTEIQPRSKLVYQGIKYRLGGKQVITEVNIGYLGFFAGPKIHIIDQYALTDPLLARIPYSGTGWRPGHFFNPMPRGYLDTIRQERNLIKNPSLAQYYDALRLVTRGSLFNRNRLIAIWKFNTGQYNYLMDAYLAR